jgi:hypothetical protein
MMIPIRVEPLIKSQFQNGWLNFKNHLVLQAFYHVMDRKIFEAGNAIFQNPKPEPRNPKGFREDIVSSLLAYDSTKTQPSTQNKPTTNSTTNTFY